MKIPTCDVTVTGGTDVYVYFYNGERTPYCDPENVELGVWCGKRIVFHRERKSMVVVPLPTPCASMSSLEGVICFIELMLTFTITLTHDDEGTPQNFSGCLGHPSPHFARQCYLEPRKKCSTSFKGAGPTSQNLVLLQLVMVHQYKFRRLVCQKGSRRRRRSWLAQNGSCTTPRQTLRCSYICARLSPPRLLTYHTGYLLSATSGMAEGDDLVEGYGQKKCACREHPIGLQLRVRGTFIKIEINPPVYKLVDSIHPSFSS